MDKKTAVQQIFLIRDQIGRTRRIAGRAKYINKLAYLMDLIEHYEADDNFSIFCVDQAKKLLAAYQEELDREDQVGLFY